MNRQTAFGLVIGFALMFAGNAAAQVKIGVGAPITGGSAAFGAQLKHGVEQAVEDINAGGGILGQIGSIVGTIFGTNVKRGRLSTGQVIARDVTRSVTNKVIGGVVADLGKSVGGSLGSSIGRSLVRGALGGLLRR